MNSMHRTLAAAALLALAPAATAQQRWTITPEADNSIYEDPPGGTQSNGAFEGLFAGNTTFGLARRALIQFDIAGNIPAGSTITGATLYMTVTQAPPGVPSHPFSLHPLTAAWGEGTSNSGPPGGLGAPAVPGDATWINAVEPATPWTTAGGDFGAASATTGVASSGTFTWSGAGMVADVQAWLDGTAANNGWIVIGDEINMMTARRFGSREILDVDLRPRLVIDYTSADCGLLAGPFPTFCDASDGALALCPCANAGSPETGCDIQQGTGGVQFEIVCQQVTPNNRATANATGFPGGSTPTSILIRSTDLEPIPVVFGDGLRCVGLTAFTRLAATSAAGGTAVHTFGHGAMAGSGSFFYQAWFRNTPAMFCTPDAFNLSNGQLVEW